MAVTIIKYNPLRIENGKKYLPVLTVVNRKIYRISDWNELFKILMYSYCYKSNNVHSVKSDINMHQTRLKTITLISDRVEESSLFTKFSPELYIRVFKHTASNLALLHIVMDYVKRKDFTVFLAKYDVILVDVNKELLDDESMLFYVGSSRAKLQLSVIAVMNEDDCTEVVKAFGSVVKKRDPKETLAKLLACKQFE